MSPTDGFIRSLGSIPSVLATALRAMERTGPAQRAYLPTIFQPGDQCLHHSSPTFVDVKYMVSKQRTCSSGRFRLPSREGMTAEDTSGCSEAGSGGGRLERTCL